MSFLDDIFKQDGKPTSSILFATAIADSEDGMVRVVFADDAEYDEDGDVIPDIVVDLDDDYDDTDEYDVEDEESVLFFDDTEEE